MTSPPLPWWLLLLPRWLAGFLTTVRGLFLLAVWAADCVSPGGVACRSPNPNNPIEYCSTVPPTQQANARAPLPTVMVPTGVLKRHGESAALHSLPSFLPVPPPPFFFFFLDLSDSCGFFFDFFFFSPLSVVISK